MFSSVMIGAITLPNSLLGLVLKGFRLLVESSFLSQLLSVISGHFDHALAPLSRLAVYSLRSPNNFFGCAKLFQAKKQAE
jgi:hypothetical protein